MIKSGAGVGGRFRFEWKIRDKKTGEMEEFVDESDNAVVVQGLNYMLNTVVGSRDGAAGVLSCFVGLKGAGAVDSADTYASHAGWTDITSTGTDRKLYWPGAASAGQVTNSSSKAAFAITSAWVVAGAYMLNSMATWGGPHLIAASNIASSRTVDSGDTINVTYTLTASNQ